MNGSLSIKKGNSTALAVGKGEDATSELIRSAVRRHLPVISSYLEGHPAIGMQYRQLESLVSRASGKQKPGEDVPALFLNAALYLKKVVSQAYLPIVLAVRVPELQDAPHADRYAVKFTLPKVLKQVATELSEQSFRSHMLSISCDTLGKPVSVRLQEYVHVNYYNGRF